MLNNDTLNSVFEGLISLTVIIGAGWMVNYHSDNVAVIGLASSATSAVIVFWFGQRATTKAVDGNIKALADISAQVKNETGPMGPTGPTGPAGPMGGPHV